VPCHQQQSGDGLSPVKPPSDPGSIRRFGAKAIINRVRFKQTMTPSLIAWSHKCVLTKRSGAYAPDSKHFSPCPHGQRSLRKSRRDCRARIGIYWAFSCRTSSFRCPSSDFVWKRLDQVGGCRREHGSVPVKDRLVAQERNAQTGNWIAIDPEPHLLQGLVQTSAPKPCT